MPGTALDSALQTETKSSGAVPFAPALAALLAAFSAVYLPSVGHGFLKDDFGWILRSPLNSWDDALAFWRGAPSGFFRPLVSLSFGVNRWGCGLQPRCYGLSNLVLLLACAAAIFVLVRGLGLSKGNALLASALWIFNWHGINTSALWISSRTALLLVLFAVLAVGAFVRERFGLAAVLSLAAMFSKEEGIVIPIVLLVSHAVLNRTSTARIPLALFALAAGAGQLLYLILRAPSGAITFGNAPEVYAPSFTFSRLMENLPEYFDRTSTFTAVIVLLAVAMCRPSITAFRKPDWPIVVFGLLWWTGGLALTMFLPVRSSLYACLPSVGSVLIGTVVISGVWSSVPRSRQRIASLAGLALPFCCGPSTESETAAGFEKRTFLYRRSRFCKMWHRSVAPARRSCSRTIGPPGRPSITRLAPRSRERWTSWCRHPSWRGSNRRRRRTYRGLRISTCGSRCGAVDWSESSNWRLEPP